MANICEDPLPEFKYLLMMIKMIIEFLVKSDNIDVLDGVLFAA